MNHFLGEETFKNGLIKYLQKFEYSNANRNDLFTSLTEEARSRNVLGAGETVKHIMDTWTEQAGFPVINVAPDYSRNTLKIVQVITCKLLQPVEHMLWTFRKDSF